MTVGKRNRPATERPRAKPGDITPGPLADNIGFNLKLATTALERARKKMTGTDLPLGHFPILFLIHQNPEATQTAIAEAVGLQRSSLVPVLKKLEEFGWITRAEAPADGRANRIRLTEKGQTACETHLREIDMVEDRARRQLGTRNYQRLVDLLRQLHHGLND